jgi:AcrR family transcriptional regulator
VAVGEDTRTRILDAAAACIADEGYAALRTAGIARAAGVSSALLHYHFATKDHLVEAAVRHSFAATTLLDQTLLRDEGVGIEHRLATYLDRCLPSDEDLRRDWLLWQELAVLGLRSPTYAAVAADLDEVTRSRVADLVREGLEHGVFHDCDPDVVARAAVSLCDGLGAKVLWGDPRTTLEDARAAVARTVAAMLGCDLPLPLPGIVVRATDG